ncbi:hypothetical protein EOM81_01660 [bacterium]|nr:hypothetical protein [bacterium]
MNIIVFDTETIDLKKPFCYNLGYVVYDTDRQLILEKRDFMISQVWNNQALFATAYYTDKKALYIGKMRSRQTLLEYWGFVMGQLRRDVAKYEVAIAYAYNSTFDDRVLTFNCEWFKTQNGLDNVKIVDLYGIAIYYIANQTDYQLWAIANNRTTATGLPSATAENVYQFLTNNLEFIEEHTALADSLIETEILIECLNRGAKIGEERKASISLQDCKPELQTLEIVLNSEKVAQFDYFTRTNRKNKIYLKK